MKEEGGSIRRLKLVTGVETSARLVKRSGRAGNASDSTTRTSAAVIKTIHRERDAAAGWRVRMRALDARWPGADSGLDADADSDSERSSG